MDDTYFAQKSQTNPKGIKLDQKVIKSKSTTDANKALILNDTSKDKQLVLKP